MKITTSRKISQFFFFALFIWFCIVSQLGEKAWQLRGWPVNLLLQLDPLIALSTLLTTQTIYKGLIWAILTIILTIILGRFFCSWICPLGTLQHVIGFLTNRKNKKKRNIVLNEYHPAQNIKYYILLFLLCTCLFDLLHFLIGFPLNQKPGFVIVGIIILGSSIFFIGRSLFSNTSNIKLKLFIFFFIWGIIGFLSFESTFFKASSLQIGLLDPISLIYRSVNLVILPLLNSLFFKSSLPERLYDGTFLIGILFITIILITLFKPRFYCRFICPLGALFGFMTNFSLWKIGKNPTANTLKKCKNCNLCQVHCEGACEPSNRIRTSECVLCFNCMDDCIHTLVTYQTMPSSTGEIQYPDLHRREIVASLISGLTVIPIIRLNGSLYSNWNPKLIRPPGALVETDFLDRCIKCGQCMRICPTNVLHPSGVENGIESLWTPVLNFRIGTSGCQLNCVACGNVCPTSAIRFISLNERLGKPPFDSQGPIRIGTAFVDRGRCLPWAMKKPCIVCQENCPVSPKAITTQAVYETIMKLEVKTMLYKKIVLKNDVLIPGQLSTGDYYVIIDAEHHKIIENKKSEIIVSSESYSEMQAFTDDLVEIQIRLLRPHVRPDQCIGCGVCEHECPVKGKRAIRVSAENETRDNTRKLIL